MTRETIEKNLKTNLEKLKRFKQLNPQAIEGKINWYSKKDEGQKQLILKNVGSFSLDYVLPCKNDRIETMIKKYNTSLPDTTKEIMEQIEAIFNEFTKAKGEFYNWI